MEPDAPQKTGLAHARVGLLGNPSDAYGGAAVAFALANFAAQVSVAPAATLEIEDDLAAPLVDATLHRYRNHTGVAAQPLRISLRTDIPFQAGLSGSSALVIAATCPRLQSSGVALGESGYTSVVVVSGASVTPPHRPSAV